MKKSTFIGNFAAWVVVAAASVAFLAWYHMTDFEVVSAAIGDSALVQLGVVLASPLLLYAIGALIGLLLVWFKRIRMGRVSRTACLVLALLVLAFVLLAAVPALAPDTAGALMIPTVVVVYVTMVAPIMVMFFGFLYALGIAPVDAAKRGPLSRHLPDERAE
ncbi:hypothetical protein E0L17_04960 [Olsenella sp. SW781]|uniref:hypothetical protein n=1 Tax=Olsenella sp. SW781 TaxID=2530046 RepID=UPI001438809C|nr:hypothetical protein [Olsenella sp. SW781]NJE80675.1 hypothetical protein [Olsenella sp. SW781]